MKSSKKGRFGRKSRFIIKLSSRARGQPINLTQTTRSRAAEAHWAHIPEAAGSNPVSAIT